MTLLRTQLGNTLRGHRQSQRRTLRDVSGVARVSLGYLSEVERGQKEASSELLASICDALDLELADLLAEVSLELRGVRVGSARAGRGPAAGAVAREPVRREPGRRAADRGAAGARPAGRRARPRPRGGRAGPHRAAPRRDGLARRLIVRSSRRHAPPGRRVLDLRRSRCQTGHVLADPLDSSPHRTASDGRFGAAMGRTRLGLLAGAARAFADQGLRRSTMQSVAAAAGVAKATLYNHFRTKDEVARALMAARAGPAERGGLGPADGPGAGRARRRARRASGAPPARGVRARGARRAAGHRSLGGADRPAGHRTPGGRGRRRAGRPLAARRRAPARPVDGAAPAGRTARRRDRALSRRLGSGSGRRGPRPDRRGPGRGACSPRGRRGTRAPPRSPGRATACTTRAPVDTASSSNQRESRAPSPARRWSSRTASRWR